MSGVSAFVRKVAAVSDVDFHARPGVLVGVAALVRLAELVTEARAIVAGDGWASEAEIEEAREQYGSTEVEIDPGAEASRVGGGLWVAGWLWLYRDENDGEDASDVE